ncbi:MAG: hypothetical protein JXA96_10060 [Sedimentisphaerales bacterium]|nr:hypothetical protein [Sedimentisphaerales bacterium]
MKNNNDKKWLEFLLSRYIHRDSKNFDFQQWIQKHPEEAKLLQNGFESSNKETKISKKQIWRFIMESRLTRYSAAAVVALAFILVLSNPFGSSKYGGVVLADVQKRVAGIETCMIRGTKTWTNPAKPGEVFEFGGIKWHFDLIKYFSKQYGLVEEGYVDNQLIYRITLNVPKHQAFAIMPQWKKYALFNDTDNQLQPFLESVTPDGIVNFLLESTYKELGRGNIDGVDVEGFEFQNAKRFTELFPKFLADFQEAKGKVWIGIEEQLPVQVEGDMVFGKSLMTMLNDLNLHEFNIISDYNIELDDAIFDISIPEGYTELTLVDILSVIPTSIKAGTAGAGLGIILIPTGIISWRRHNRKKRAQTQKK